MQGYLQILTFVVIGIVLLWFGFNVFVGGWTRIRLAGGRYGGRDCNLREQQSRNGKANHGSSDDPQACPICSVRLRKGELVRTHAFPSITGGHDRLMHVRGCVYCIDGQEERYCPVCQSPLDTEEFLIARIFERSHRRNHVHILGCTKCRGRKIR